MSHLILLGMSHRSAPVELRERLAVPGGALKQELSELTQRGPLREALLISTCNRVELYAATEDPHAAEQAVRAFLSERAAAPIDDYLYAHNGSDAVRHAFRVAASLDSMVVGEPQILGQVKEAYEAAETTGTLGALLGRCFTRAFSVAKRVRSETAIAAGTVSVSSIACELAAKIFGDLEGRRALLLGAGEMGEAAAKSLSGTGARLWVINRSPEKAERLAEACGGTARGYEHLASELVAADVVITSTSADRYVLTHDLMKDVVKARRGRPLFLIDIAVPRDVDPRVGELSSVFLYDVDDLSKVAEENLSARRRAAVAAEAIVEAEVEEFERWWRSLELTPTIVALRDRFTRIVEGELERTLPRLTSLSEAERKALDKMAHAMVNKLLHVPVSQLKKHGGDTDASQLIHAAQTLFELVEERDAQQAVTKAPAVGAFVAAGARKGDPR